jgi:hypothetical protein
MVYFQRKAMPAFRETNQRSGVAWSTVVPTLVPLMVE